ncbi:hypothetical protein B0H14DRAFT_2621182 [Mycena olivaceomarginata]|nr:hypothetical protein B0H14DRAFT_2621182 [Mycena olivaceomarginata]
MRATNSTFQIRWDREPETRINRCQTGDKGLPVEGPESTNGENDESDEEEMVADALNCLSADRDLLRNIDLCISTSQMYFAAPDLKAFTAVSESRSDGETFHGLTVNYFVEYTAVSLTGIRSVNYLGSVESIGTTPIKSRFHLGKVAYLIGFDAPQPRLKEKTVGSEYLRGKLSFFTKLPMEPEPLEDPVQKKLGSKRSRVKNQPRMKDTSRLEDTSRQPLRKVFPFRFMVY